jgi:hypothetical protein
VIATCLFLYKALYLKFPILPHAESRAWDIEASIRFDAENGPVKVYLYVPDSTPNHAIVNEQFISRGYGMSARQKAGNRRVIWSLREASGKQVLFYRATVRPGTATLTQQAKTPKLQEMDLVDAQRLAAESILADVKSRSADTETLVAELMKHLSRSPAHRSDDNLKLLLGYKPTTIQKLDIAVNILALAGIPARMAHGVRLQELTRSAQRIHLLQVYHRSGWSTYNATTGEPFEDDNILVWWFGKESLINVKGGHNISSQLSVSENREPAMLGASWREKVSQPVLSEFSLLGLPIETQVVYQILLTVPVGVFLLVILRNVIGVKTFGTFMPVLIAMAFRETQLLWGVMLFSLVVGLGLSVRFYLEHLKLLLVPRLAAVLILVIILMTLISVMSHKMGFYQGLSVALFPMVILAMTIERMSIVWEERGAAESIKQGLGSLLVASLAYLVMKIELIKHLVFVFPEVLLFLLAAVLLLGRYSGYRLLELGRFKVLAREKQ